MLRGTKDRYASASRPGAHARQAGRGAAQSMGRGVQKAKQAGQKMAHGTGKAARKLQKAGSSMKNNAKAGFHQEKASELGGK